VCQKFRRIGLLVLLVIVGAMPAHGAESRLRLTSVSEQLDRAMPVTAVSAVGLALASTGSADSTIDEPASIWIRVPPDLVGTVTVRLTTIDGRYVAKVVFDVNGGPQDWEQITLPSNLKGRDATLRDAIFKEYSRHHFAYAVSLESQAKGDSVDVWLPVASEDPRGGASLKTAVLLNAAGAETVFFQLPGAKKPVMCRPIGGQRARHFNTACELTLNEALLVASSPGASLMIRRASGAEYLDPVMLTLR
jgi:hypothetical protein